MKVNSSQFDLQWKLIKDSSRNYQSSLQFSCRDVSKNSILLLKYLTSHPAIFWYYTQNIIRIKNYLFIFYRFNACWQLQKHNIRVLFV